MDQPEYRWWRCLPLAVTCGLAVSSAVTGCAEPSCRETFTCPAMASADRGGAGAEDAGGFSAPGTGGTFASTPEAGGITGTGGVAGSSGAGALDSGGSGGQDANPEADAGALDPLPACAGAPDDSAGLFLSASGDDTTDCGAREAPCQTLGFALQRAMQASASTLYVGAGDFAAGVELNAPLVISGGWDASWNRDCESPSATVLQAPAGAPSALVVRDLAGTARLEYLNIRGKAAVDVGPGESVYGILVSGDTSVLELVAVDVSVPAAGDGADGQGGATPAAASGTCTTSGDGLSGPAGAAGQGNSGQFLEGGYLAGDGELGTAGGVGGNGQRTLAVNGAAETFSCVSPCGNAIAVVLDAGEDGQPGCGGDGGGAGTPGSGGGSSIALYVWGAQVEISAGSFTADDGGNGGDGGDGAPGASGSSGVDGAPGPVETVEPSCCGTPTDVRAPGGQGFDGGQGGPGGAAGSGAGGHSYGIYLGGGGSVERSAGTIVRAGVAGEGGVGPIPGADGLSSSTNF